MDGELQRRCPRRPILENPTWFSDVMWRYSQKENGFLPVAGGTEDQPNIMVQTWRVIDAARNRAEAHEREAKKIKQRRAAVREGVAPNRGSRPRKH